MTDGIDQNLSDNSQWVLSTSQENKYRRNGEEKSITGHSTKIYDFGVNNRESEKSDFNLGDVFVFNRELSIDEIKQVEGYIAYKFNLPIKSNYSLPKTVDSETPTSEKKDGEKQTFFEKYKMYYYIGIPIIIIAIGSFFMRERQPITPPINVDELF
jgi:hypothetical protein